MVFAETSTLSALTIAMPTPDTCWLPSRPAMQYPLSATDRFASTAQLPPITFPAVLGFSVAESSKTRMPMLLPRTVLFVTVPPRDSRTKMPRCNPSDRLLAISAFASAESPTEMPAVPTVWLPVHDRSDLLGLAGRTQRR